MVDGALVLCALSATPRCDWIDYHAFPRVELASLSDQQCEMQLRFRTVSVVQRLRKLLLIPDRLVLASRKVFAGDEALMLLCAFMARPLTLDELAVTYGRRPSALSELMHHMYHHVMEHFGKRCLRNLRRWKKHLPVWAEAIQEKMQFPTPLGVHSFTDGVNVGICRPKFGQSGVFNGKDRKHTVKFITMMAPNGLQVYTSRAAAGCCHDAKALANCGMMTKLKPLHDELRPAHGQLCTGGDKAFGPTPDFQVPFKGANLSADEFGFNLVRISACCYMLRSAAARVRPLPPAPVLIRAYTTTSC